MESNLEKRTQGFTFKNHVRGAGLIATAIYTVISLGGCYSYHRERPVREVQRPVPMSAYHQEVKNVENNRLELAKKLGVADDSGIKYDELVKKAKEMLETDLAKKHVPYSIEQVQAVYALVHKTARDKEKSHEIHTIESGLIKQLMKYHFRIAGESSRTPEEKYFNALTAAYCALALNDKQSFNQIYQYLKTYRNKKNISAAKTERIAVLYPDIYENVRQGKRTKTRDTHEERRVGDAVASLNKEVAKTRENLQEERQADAQEERKYHDRISNLEQQVTTLQANLQKERKDDAQEDKEYKDRIAALQRQLNKTPEERRLDAARAGDPVFSVVEQELNRVREQIIDIRKRIPFDIDPEVRRFLEER